MNDLVRPALYDGWHEVVAVEPPPAQEETWDIVGPVCESGDFLARDRKLALAGDTLLAIMDTGAYGFVMASSYNSRPRAPEVVCPTVPAVTSFVVARRFADLMAGESTLENSTDLAIDAQR